MIRLFGICATVLAIAACGFDCKVNGADEHFNDCTALQARFSQEQSQTSPPPDEKTLNDLNTCGSVNGCDIQQ